MIWLSYSSVFQRLKGRNCHRCQYRLIISGALPPVAHDAAVNDVDSFVDTVLLLVAQLHLHRGLARQQSILEGLVSNQHLFHLLANGPSREIAAFVEASL